MLFDSFERNLRQAWGDEAAKTRHEIFFLSRRSPVWRQVLRAAFALARDALVCLLLPKKSIGLCEVVAVVSLSGASGWGALSDLVATIKSCVIRHPRLHPLYSGSTEAIPCRPGFIAWRTALKAIVLQRGEWNLPGASPWVVRFTVARHRLWKGCWQRTLADTRTRALVLHNDFDMFSAAAASAAQEMGISSFCVQHGLPTDEFFPARADVHVVWGESSRKVYEDHGVPPSRIVVGTSRLLALDPYLDIAPQSPPTKCFLISQTHTPVFGRLLEDDFVVMATRMSSLLTNDFVILLHPEESRVGEPYTRNELETYYRHAPHAVLNAVSRGAEPALVIGFCSTALLDAAVAGNFVLGLDWDVPASHGALAVGRPPLLAHSAEEVRDYFQRLRKDSRLRDLWWRMQHDWLQATYTPINEKWIELCVDRIGL